MSSLDGFKIAEFDASKIEFITNRPNLNFASAGFAQTIVALKDKITNKCYKASLATLIHLGASKLNIRPMDTANN